MRALIAAALAALLMLGSVPAFASVPEAALAGDAAAPDAAAGSTGDEGPDAVEDAIDEKGSGFDAALLAVGDLASEFAELASNAASFVEAVLGESLETPAIQNGTYYIVLASDPSLVLDVSAGSQDAGANVTLWDSTAVMWQKFIVTYLGGGYYSLVAEHSGQALDVVASGTEVGTNVTQWTDSGTENQQWVIRDLGDGTYDIVSRCNGLSLVAAGSEAGSNVEMGEYGSGSWVFIEAYDPVPSSDFEDGTYTIATVSDTSLVLDVTVGSTESGANVTLWTSYDATWQSFRIEHVGDGYYSIIAEHSGCALAVEDSSRWPFANVCQETWTGADNQLWIIEAVGDGSYRIVSKYSELVLGCETPAADGSNVHMETPDGVAASQTWTFSVAKNADATISDGVYTIANAANENQVLDVVSGSQEEGANVTLWDYTNVQWQRFRITSVGNGLYRITPLHSGQALDVVASGTESGTNVTQWGWWETDNQLWSIVSYIDGSVSFVSSCNGLALAIDGEAVSGANVQVETYNSNDQTQRWVLNECSTRDSFKIYLDAGHGWSSSTTGVYDPGAQALGYVEAGLTVDLVNRIAEICQNKYGLCVYSNADIGGLYWERHPEAVDLGCSTFLSIHFNAGGGTGSESYIHSYNAASGSAAFQDIMHSWLLFGTGLTDRGQKSAALAVTGGSLPSVLLEICFIDSISDMMTYNANIDRIAEAIALGISEAADDPTCQL